MSMPEQRYVPALTGLRGVAAWWVVLYHFTEPLIWRVPDWVLALVKQGYLAVDLFFILSGYVIYLTSSDSLRVLAWRPVSRFWLNRVVRIYPLHLFLMLLYLVNPFMLWAFSSSGVGLGRYDWDYFVASIFLVQNWGAFDSLQWNIPAWSISTEFAAYLLCPLLIAVGLVPLTHRRRELVFAIWGAAMAIGVIFWAAGEYSIGEAIPSLGVVRCVLEFWMGLCLSALRQGAAVASRAMLAVNSILIFILVAVFVGLLMLGFPNQWFVPFVFACLIYLLSRGDVLFSKFLSLPIFHYLGLISYSTYLVHYFIKDWVKFLSESFGWFQFFGYLLVCFFSSVVLFRYIEEPSRRIFRKKFMLASS